MPVDDRWSKLSMRDRADLIKIYTKHGVTDLNEIRRHYNSFNDDSTSYNNTKANGGHLFAYGTDGDTPFEQMLRERERQKSIQQTAALLNGTDTRNRTIAQKQQELFPNGVPQISNAVVYDTDKRRIQEAREHNNDTNGKTWTADVNSEEYQAMKSIPSKVAYDITHPANILDRESTALMNFNPGVLSINSAIGARDAYNWGDYGKAALLGGLSFTSGLGLRTLPNITGGYSHYIEQPKNYIIIGDKVVENHKIFEPSYYRKQSRLEQVPNIDDAYVESIGEPFIFDNFGHQLPNPHYFYRQGWGIIDDALATGKIRVPEGDYKSIILKKYPFLDNGNAFSTSLINHKFPYFSEGELWGMDKKFDKMPEDIIAIPDNVWGSKWVAGSKFGLLKPNDLPSSFGGRGTPLISGKTNMFPTSKAFLYKYDPQTKKYKVVDKFNTNDAKSFENIKEQFENENYTEFRIMLERARSGDGEAIEQLNKYGIPMGNSGVYRFANDIEVKNILNGEKYMGRFNDGNVDVTSSNTPTTASSKDYRITFKDNFDLYDDNPRTRLKNAELKDGYITDGYSLDDIAKIEQLIDGEYIEVPIKQFSVSDGLLQELEKSIESVNINNSIFNYNKLFDTFDFEKYKSYKK